MLSELSFGILVPTPEMALRAKISEMNYWVWGVETLGGQGWGHTKDSGLLLRHFGGLEVLIGGPNGSKRERHSQGSKRAIICSPVCQENEVSRRYT